jgi:fructose-bisphosphate aldolase, class I
MPLAEANRALLAEVAGKLMADGKGLLAIDESPVTCNRRFAETGTDQTFENRRAYRDMIVTTPDLGRSISGAILQDETIGQRVDDGRSFAGALSDAGIIPGIKVDIGARPLAGHVGEKVTEGLDGLRERLADYAERGARFTKWRAVLAIDHDRPSHAGIAVNASAHGRYAALCQEVGLVPVVEPEVLMDGEHDVARCGRVTENVLRHVFAELVEQDVMLEGLILKPNMILPGLASAETPAVEDVADRTLACLLRAVPAAVPGIAFLSGG